MTLRRLARFASFCRNLVQRHAREHELQAEIAACAGQLADEGHAAGYSPGEAARRANLALGGAEQVKEQVRTARAGAWLESLLRDLRLGARQLRRNPGFTAVAVLALALGIGANTALFSLVEGVLLRPLPYPGADRVAVVTLHFAPQNNPRGPLSLADYLDWRAANRSFEELGLFAPRNFDLAGVAQPQKVLGALATSGVFAALRVKPLLGRGFHPADDLAAAAPVALVSEPFWHHEMRGRADAVGSVIKLNQQPVTIVGVMPAGFQFPLPGAQVWLAMTITPPNRRGPFDFRGLARLRDGVSWQQAQAETNSIGAAIERANPETYHHLSMPIEPLLQALVGDVARPLWVMMGTVLAVLVIAAVNVASLLLARAEARAPEMAVRASLGAGRARLIRQLLTESCLLALLGATVGLGVAELVLQWVRAAIPGNLPRLEGVRLDGGVLLFTLAAAIAVGMLAGLAPALRGARARRSFNATVAHSTRAARPHELLAGVEMALALLLLITSGLLLRSFAHILAAPDGYQAPARSLLVTPLSIRGHALATRLDQYSNNPADIAYFDRLLGRVRSDPGVEDVAISDALPPSSWFDDDTFTIRGQPWSPGDFPSTPLVTISPDYFRTMGIPLVAGRFFNDADVASSEPVVIISQALAERHFPGRSPLGEDLKPSEPALTVVQGSQPGQKFIIPYCRIVGVVGNVHYQRGAGDSLQAYYVPYDQSSATVVNVIVRTTLPASTVAPWIRSEASSIYPDTVISATRNMQAIAAQFVGGPRFLTTLVGLFALLALVLAVTGVYGVLAYGVSRRQREIGVRMALGASPGGVVTLVLRRGLAIAAAGAAGGLLAAVLLTRYLASLLVDVSNLDPLVFAVGTLALVAAAITASLIPARRAARLDPLRSLRTE